MKIAYYCSGRIEMAQTNTGSRMARATYATCDHKHKTQNGARNCAEKRRKNDGFIVAYPIGIDGYHVMASDFEATI